MQVVSRDCEQCAERIRSDSDGVGCAACDVAWHRECVEKVARKDATSCPKCGEVFGEREATAARREAATNESRVLVGRILFIAGCTALLSVTLLNVIVAVVQGEPPYDVIRLVITAALLLAVYTGREWARVVCAVLSTIGGLAGAASAFVLIGAGPLVFVVGGMAVLFLAFAALLVFRTPVRDFLDDQAVRNGHSGRP